MDTSDPEITFDGSGVCSHCRSYDQEARDGWFRGKEGQKKLQNFLEGVRRVSGSNEYNCILGLSGGVDSSFLAYLVKTWGLRPLIVHVDAGWNSELAVKNIENIVKKLDFDLFTYVVDWEEVRDLQLAFLKAGVPNQDIPQDHVIFAVLRDLASQHGIKSILTGSNIATESILPPSWGYDAMDARHLKAIHRRFGTLALKSYKIVPFWKYYLYYPFVKRMTVYKPLNFIDYNKAEAKAFLKKEFEWKDYGGKHYESRFTKYFQGYYLPTRFGFDKRRAHLSSLIVSGQITREEALKELEKPLYADPELRDDQEFVMKKLGISDEGMVNLLKGPIHCHGEYPSNKKLISFLHSLKARKNKDSLFS